MKKIQLLILAVALIFLSINSHTLTYAEEATDKLQWDIYGKVVFDGFYTSTSEVNDKPGLGRLDRFDYNLSTLSRLGVNLQYGKFEGAVEFGTSHDSIIRLLYAQYNFDNGGDLVIGQAGNIAFYNFGQMSNGQNALIDYGTLNDVRRPMIKYGMHGFNIAVISGIGLDIMGSDYSVEYFNGTDDGIIANINKASGAEAFMFEWLPRFELSYDITSRIFNGVVFASYAPYIIKSKNEGGNYKNYSINTFSVGLGGQFDIGKAYIQMSAYYGMNLTLTSMLTNTLSPEITVEGVNNKVKVKNVESAGGAIGFGYVINDMFTPQIGAGFSSSFGGPIRCNDDAWAVYANVIIQANQWLAIAPEIAFIDQMYDGNGNKQGNQVTIGVDVEIKF